jgi:hypothetical protein
MILRERFKQAIMMGMTSKSTMLRRQLEVVASPHTAAAAILAT